MNKKNLEQVKRFFFAIRKIENRLSEKIDRLTLKDEVIKEHRQKFVQHIPFLRRTPPRIQSYVFQTVKFVRNRFYKLEKRKHSLNPENTEK